MRQVSPRECKKIITRKRWHSLLNINLPLSLFHMQFLSIFTFLSLFFLFSNIWFTVSQKSEIRDLCKTLACALLNQPGSLPTSQSILVTIPSIIILPILWNQKWKCFGKRKPNYPCYSPDEIENFSHFLVFRLALWIQILLLLEFMTTNGTTDRVSIISVMANIPRQTYSIVSVEQFTSLFQDGCH